MGNNYKLLEIGDKVLIKENLKVGEEYDNGCCFVEDMSFYKGKKLTIRYITDKFSPNHVRFKVKENGYSWSLSMIEQKVNKIKFNF